MMAPTKGFSDTAQFVDRTRSEAWSELRRDSMMLGLDSAVFQELADVAKECREPDWDGYGAQPVSQETLRTAFCVLQALPLGFPAPAVGAEPDGQLTLDWYRSLRRTLSVSVSPEGELHYAALSGPNRSYGTEAFIDEVPATILNLIRRVCEDD